MSAILALIDGLPESGTLLSFGMALVIAGTLLRKCIAAYGRLGAAKERAVSLRGTAAKAISPSN